MKRCRLRVKDIDFSWDQIIAELARATGIATRCCPQPSRSPFSDTSRGAGSSNAQVGPGSIGAHGPGGGVPRLSQRQVSHSGESAVQLFVFPEYAFGGGSEIFVAGSQQVSHSGTSQVGRVDSRAFGLFSKIFGLRGRQIKRYFHSLTVRGSEHHLTSDWSRRRVRQISEIDYSAAAQSRAVMPPYLGSIDQR